MKTDNVYYLSIGNYLSYELFPFNKRAKNYFLLRRNEQRTSFLDRKELRWIFLKKEMSLLMKK